MRRRYAEDFSAKLDRVLDFIANNSPEDIEIGNPEINEFWDNPLSIDGAFKYRDGFYLLFEAEYLHFIDEDRENVEDTINNCVDRLIDGLQDIRFERSNYILDTDNIDIGYVFLRLNRAVNDWKVEFMINLEDPAIEKLSIKTAYYKPGIRFDTMNWILDNGFLTAEEFLDSLIGTMRDEEAIEYIRFIANFYGFGTELQDFLADKEEEYE